MSGRKLQEGYGTMTCGIEPIQGNKPMTMDEIRKKVESLNAEEKEWAFAVDGNMVQLDTIHPTSGDIITVTWDKNLVTPSQLSDIYDLVVEQFDEYPVLAIPKGVKIKIVSDDHGD